MATTETVERAKIPSNHYQHTDVRVSPDQQCQRSESQITHLLHACHTTKFVGQPTDQKLRLTKCCCPTTTQHCSFYCKPVHIRRQKLLLSNTEKSVDIDRLIHKAATVNTDLLVRHDGRQYYCLANTSAVWFGGIMIGCWT